MAAAGWLVLGAAVRLGIGAQTNVTPFVLAACVPTGGSGPVYSPSAALRGFRGARGSGSPRRCLAPA